MNRFTIFFILTLALMAGTRLGAESRSWRSANGNRSFRAEFVSSDGTNVVLRKLDKTTVTVALQNLHSSDRDWIRGQLNKSEAKAHGGLKGGCFDTLAYGDNRRTVEKKLKASLVAGKSLDDRLTGRTGLNGIYQTSIADEPYELFFHWTGKDELQEVTLRSRAVAQTDYGKTLRKTWASLISLLKKHHGNPVQTTGYPPQEDLQEGKLLGSHLWHTPDKHSILLCTGREGAGYLVSIRFSAELIPPNRLRDAGEAKKDPAEPGT
ncbi:MAG: hypothetical protein CMN05_15170 [Roseibacillus sp.]|jgi:hypothetical protein|nr:hypothetical protein [Roseibacillus sp.]MCP4728803.1 hypothetical protein [Roseibacillus sp.]MDP6208014.1 hypothetical protein [Roseibacillus sp.]MDP7106418.1 hypothetical protein [Roseibacillus sp.]MDP7306027.1 hypothetical protein [Roseibacillus sp.]|tara:strand:+ start:8646 stop:9440 length:795 start_codon:yes stop_codon:yes gene_type:complete